MTKQHICTIVNKEMISNDIVRIAIESPEIAKAAFPGQFLEIKCSDGLDVLLRRPISISGVKANTVEFIVQIRGQATNLLVNKEIGQSLDIIGPLGKGFTINENDKNILIIAGGIGVFPMLFVADWLKKAKVKALIGFRCKEMIVLEEEFKSKGVEVLIATDDGSCGHKGFVTDLLVNEINVSKVDKIYTCGPLSMLRKVCEIANKNEVNCEISAEERMGCGVGACLGCAIKIKDGDDWRYGHVCKDGPIFNSKKIIFE